MFLKLIRLPWGAGETVDFSFCLGIITACIPKSLCDQVHLRHTVLQSPGIEQPKGSVRDLTASILLYVV